MVNKKGFGYLVDKEKNWYLFNFCLTSVKCKKCKTQLFERDQVDSQSRNEIDGGDLYKLRCPKCFSIQINNEKELWRKEYYENK